MEDVYYVAAGVVIAAISALGAIYFGKRGTNFQVLQLARDTKRDADMQLQKQREDIFKEIEYKEKLIYSDISLVKKDVDFLKEFYWGRDAKSDPAYISGNIETIEHDKREGVGLFKDTEEEAEDRKLRDN